MDKALASRCRMSNAIPCRETGADGNDKCHGELVG
jgi:hypothetical protein